MVRAVDGLSLTVDAGELVALYGPSGSGKSTLLRIAAAIEPPDAGGVFVKGRDVTALSDKDASDYRMYVLGWINQDSDLLDGASALDNAATKQLVAVRSLRRARRSVAPLLEELGLGLRLEHRADTLSMGERQCVVIARALSLDPQVVLADEPTGSLDTRRSHDVLGLLRAATHARQMATLLVTHDEHAIAYADKVYTLQDGVLRDCGPEAVPTP
ncbi:MAG TPA: ABC transporter ATP-binding protein [Baekduia sp.]|uniref:ABC transporter ATP-binding protein n=1 Tax=Baekduia sp. TaxID=2600305 RepID=UPI002C77C4E8|nr:ABC transporter ATP-binding protein [Baekduia sp.]HMJ33887.1 ABC transporter ATP-binding protein [Baekduia sp.]